MWFGEIVVHIRGVSIVVSGRLDHAEHEAKESVGNLHRRKLEHK